MNAEKKAYISTLLPTSRITLFTQDENSRETFLSVQDDWRFARVTLSVQDGDANDAITFYDTYESPDLIIVQTDLIDDSFPGLLEQLAGNCSEGTAAIVVGPDNDVNLYRQLVGMGVSDYLVKPLVKDEFANDMANTILEKLGESGSKVIALIGVKGGVGVSALSQACAAISSETLAQKTFLLDAAGGWSTLSVGMDFEPSATLNEAVRAAADGKHDNLTRMILQKTDKLSVLSCANDPMLDANVDAEEYEALLEHLMLTCPVIFVDLSGSSPEVKKAVIARANHIIMVTSSILPSVRMARTMLKEIKDIRGGSAEDVSILLNMQGVGGKSEVPKAQIEEGIETAIVETVPYDTSLFPVLEAKGLAITSHKAGQPVVSKISELLTDIIGIDMSKSGKASSKADGGNFLGSVMGALKKK